MGSGDIIEHQFVSTLPVVFRCTLHRIPYVLDALKIHALDHLAVAYIQAGDDSFCKHTCNSFQLV